MKRHTVHISLEDEIYFNFLEKAKKDHLKLSTWIKKKILDAQTK